MVSVKNEINEILQNAVNDLESKLEDSRSVLSEIQGKMDSKVNEAKEYKVQVDSAKENIKRLEDEIKSLEEDLIELKDKYGKKNLVAVIDAGTREINSEIKNKRDEIQMHKNKITELTNRARSIKDLLINLKKDKKIKEEKLKDLEKCFHYYKMRLEEIINFSLEHEDLEDYFLSLESDLEEKDSGNVFEDIVGDEDDEENFTSSEEVEEVSMEMTDEIFNDVINPLEDEEDQDGEEIEENREEDILKSTERVTLEEEANIEEESENVFEDKLDVLEEKESSGSDLEDTRDLEISDLLSAVKEPMDKKTLEPNDKVSSINKAIDLEFSNIFGQDINEPVKSIDIFGNDFKNNEANEEDIVNKLTNIGLDYYSFTEEDKKIIKENFNEQTIANIVKILKDNKIQLDNVYVDGKILSTIAPAELESIISKLLKSGQSADAIGYVLDKLPLVDAKLLDSTIVNYGDYIKNVDIVDIIFKSLKGDN